MPRLTFKKNERLRSLKAIEELYKNGSSFNTKLFKVFFVATERLENAPCQVLFAVPKRNFKRAVDRNLLRRRMREAYRLNKNILYYEIAKEQSLQLIFLYTSKEIYLYENILSETVKAIQTLLSKIK